MDRRGPLRGLHAPLLRRGGRQDRPLQRRPTSGTNIPLFYWDDSHPTAQLCKSYFFFQYLQAQSASGWRHFQEHYRQPAIDYRAVGDAMAGDTVLSCGARKRTAFNLLLLRWHAANNLNQTSGAYGYKDAEITPVFRTSMAEQDQRTRSGGGVVKTMSEAYVDGVPRSRHPDFIYMSLTDSRRQW